MLIAIWIISGLLALLYLLVGITKIAQPKPKFVASAAGGWAADVPASGIKVIGLLEVLGALGLILPRLTGVAPGLSTVAAFALVLFQIGAMVVHLRRGEAKVLPMNLVLLVLALVVGVLSVIQA